MSTVEKFRDRPFSILSLDRLDTLIRKRIREPVISELFDEFVKNGTFQSLKEILNDLPSDFRPPVLYNLTTHVTKEKPVFVYGIGERHLDDLETVKFVAATTDLLWCLSLIVDDIIDADTQRAGRETAWYVFGKEYTYHSAETVLKILQNQMAERVSLQARDLLIECVSDGIKSVRDPVMRRLDTNIENILSNIDHRARFHCEYPVRAMLTNITEENKQIIESATDGLFCVNRAGQVLNDVKDLIPSGIYGRGVFSDIRSATATIPLIMLYEELEGWGKERLKSCFGNSSLTQEQIEWLTKIVAQELPRKALFSLVSENYKRFLERMSDVIAQDYFDFCKKWVEYKQDQAIKLLTE